MIDLQGLLDEIEACLDDVAQFLVDQPASVDAGRSLRQELDWLNRQVASIQTHLQALQSDLAAGMSPAELGFEDGEALIDHVLDVRRQIGLLQIRQRSLVQQLQR